MPWIICPVCEGTRKVTESGRGRCPERFRPVEAGDDCPACKDSSRPGHVYREFLA